MRPRKISIGGTQTNQASIDSAKQQTTLEAPAKESAEA
jgi:hypothetical protein